MKGADAFEGLFDGVRVLSLAEHLPGPFATMLLADLKSDAGQKQFEALARTADVVIEGFRPSVMDQLSLGSNILLRLNPRLISVSVSDFGQTGLYRDRTALNLSCQSLAGHLIGAVPAIPYGDLAGAMFAAFSISSALFARERTGHGTSIDVSMADSLASWMTPFLGPALNGHPLLDLRTKPGYGMFTCHDGKVLSLSIAHEDHFWRALCRLLNLVDVAGRGTGPRGWRSCVDASPPSRLARIVRPGVRCSTRRGFPWSPVHDVQAVTEDPHFQARGLFAQVPGGDGTWVVQQPAHFGRHATALYRGVPALSQHTREVLETPDAEE